MDYALTIDGQSVAGELSQSVVNPATGKSFADAPCASHQQLELAVDAAERAFVTWGATSIEERQQLLRRIADTIDANRGELAPLLTREQGKPLRRAHGEVKATAAFFRYFAGLDIPEETVEESATRSVVLRRKPLGVVAAILPWNYPLLTLANKLPACLLAGNTVVLKPAPTTPLTTLRLCELIAPLLPPGVVNAIADRGELGSALASHPKVRKVSFTGSTVTGQKVMAAAAGTLKRLTLELGGNDAAIVLDDVDVQSTAKAVFDSAFENSGQVCLAIKRLYVHADVHDEMCAALSALAEKAVVGDGMQDGVQFGPVQNKAQYDRVRELIADARAHGNVESGEGAVHAEGYFIRPTIVRDVTDGVRLVDEEQFGPVLPVIKVHSAEEAINLANASPYGLGGSVWTKNEEFGKHIASRLEAGTVWVNKHQDIAPNIPFSGAKSSGLGVEFGLPGVLEFTQMQVMNLLPRQSPTPSTKVSAEGVSL
jgi:acyl-CoA reductase-like NAD-dependent aldehyde dehydrogenase